MVIEAKAKGTTIFNDSDRHTCHGFRKAMAQKLRAANLEESQILKIGGWRNPTSLSTYDEQDLTAVAKASIALTIKAPKAHHHQQASTMSLLNLLDDEDDDDHGSSTVSLDVQPPSSSTVTQNPPHVSGISMSNTTSSNTAQQQHTWNTFNFAGAIFNAPISFGGGGMPTPPPFPIPAMPLPPIPQMQWNPAPGSSS